MEEIRIFLQALGTKPATVSEETIEICTPIISEAAWLKECLSGGEVMGQLKLMRESAAGDDEVTTTRLQKSGSILKDIIFCTIQRLWQTALAIWQAELHAVTGFRLFKKRDSKIAATSGHFGLMLAP